MIARVAGGGGAGVDQAFADLSNGPGGVFAQRLVRGLESVSRGQHPSGEMLSFRRDPEGNYEYVRSPFVSTFVHDALACFDPSSSGWLDGSLDLLPRAFTSAWCAPSQIRGSGSAASSSGSKSQPATGGSSDGGAASIPT